MLQKSKIKLGISVGDLHGIGLQVILKTFQDNKILQKCTPIIFAPYNICCDYTNIVEEKPITLNKINSIQDLHPNKINILENKKYNHKLSIGIPSKQSGLIAFDSLNDSCKALEKKEIDVLVTAPIDKYQIRRSINNFIGHTEFLESKFVGSSLMMMISSIMKIAFVTGHIPLSEVSTSITKEKIIEKAKRLNNSLITDFNILKPKIAILGLNPHSGENGMLGKEEDHVISPAINTINKKYNILAKGPFPADSFFTNTNLSLYDGILAMYHDQGLIPFKALSFSDGVNFTAGLNIIRTSPVHGVAYDIGATGNVNEKSFKSAVISACQILKTRDS